jgi:hypothetical protein
MRKLFIILILVGVAFAQKPEGYKLNVAASSEYMKLEEQKETARKVYADAVEKQRLLLVAAGIPETVRATGRETDGAINFAVPKPSPTPK